MDISNLPLNWSTEKLGNLVEFKYGKSLPDKQRTGKGFPVFGSNGIVGFHENSLTSGATIIVGRKGSVGAVKYSNTACSPIDTTYYVDEVPSGNFKYWLYQLKALRLNELNKSTAIPGLSRADAYALTLALPPDNEQRRIADKLDTVLTRVDAVQDRLARITPLLKRFRQSILAAATSGRLTEEWRLENRPQSVLESELINIREAVATSVKEKRIIKDIIEQSLSSLPQENLPEEWLKTSIGMAGIVSNGSTPSRSFPEYWDGDIPWVSSGEVRNNLISKTKESITQIGFDSTSVRVLPIGTVLIAMIGEGKTRGQSALLELSATINQNIAAVIPVEKVLKSKYLWYWFQSQYESNRRAGNGTGPQALNCQKVRELPLNLPPLAEQTEIVRRVELLMGYADRLEARLQAAQTAAEHLTPALLAKAFRGELVPQDPNDEPAAELLRRLREARATEAPAKPKRGRKAGAAGQVAGA